METRHVKINPTATYPGLTTTLEHACKELEAEGWALLRIVPHHQYECIAVFERPERPEHIDGRDADA